MIKNKFKMKIGSFYHSATETFQMQKVNKIYLYKIEESARKRIQGEN